MNYLKNIFSTGAVRKTPLSILKKINSFINPDQQLSVIELGAGKGEITRSVLKKISIPETYLAFEIDKDYCRN
jgi:phospholipid N-methyltransferase